MPAFTFNSSPPSTPGSAKRPGEHPSTTPAGPPPSAPNTFAPAGKPPSILFRDSKAGPKNCRSDQTSVLPSGNEPKRQTHINSTKVSLNDVAADQEYQDADENEEMDVEYPMVDNEENGFDFDEAYDWNSHGDTRRRGSGANALKASNQDVAKDDSLLGASLLRPSELALSTAAKSLVRSLGQPELTESDQLILQTESQVNKMYDEHLSAIEQQDLLDKALKVVPEGLRKVWQTCCNEVEHSTDEERGNSIGPFDQDPPIYKATFVGSLLLSLNHPPTRIIQAPPKFKYSSNSTAVTIATAEAYPKVLVDWLENDHNPYRSALPRLRRVQPNPTASSNFWDLILSSTLRGRIEEVAALLAGSDFEFAASAKEDGSATRGYKDSQLHIVDLVIGRAAARLQSCPALQFGDWNVTNNKWATWRLDVEEELSELIRLAEDESQETAGQSLFEAENFGISTRSQRLSVSTRKAQSKVPCTVYESLKALYSIFLGSAPDIINLAQDWLEASLALAIWWDGNDILEFDSSTASFRKSHRNELKTRMVDVDVVKAYRSRLMIAFDTVTKEEGLQVDEHNPVEVAIASILQGNIQDTFSILRTWSLPITSAAMEVGTEADWYQSIHPDLPPDFFDESDLMVLSYARPEQPVSKDGVLIEYAQMLLDRAPLHYSAQEIQGWELAIEFVGRVDNSNAAVKIAQEIIKDIAITDDRRADRLISVCKEYHLYKEAAEIAEVSLLQRSPKKVINRGQKYADTIPETTGSYGTALIYYARAHNVKKVKDVLDLLISYCLVQSSSFPPTNKLDSHLLNLLNKPRETISAIAAKDQEAAEILSAQFSGYATIRKFYDIRDGEPSGFTSSRDRRRAAAVALLTTIQSAADNIQGGLYDAENPAVIPVDCLLTLLGEASVFVNHRPRLLSLDHLLILLRAIEDLNAVHSRIKERCAECFASTLAAAHGAAQPDPRELMRKTISDLTAESAFSHSTTFSLLGDSIMSVSNIGSSYENIAAAGSDNRTSANLVRDKHRRTWDWRQGFRQGTKPGKLIKMLRLALAEEVADAWVEAD